jgi:hypothetical protein
MIHRLSYIYRPIQTSDGLGGFDENFTDPLRCFIAVTNHNNILKGSVKAGCNLCLNDLIDVEDVFYRVTHIEHLVRDNHFTITIEKVDRPFSLGGTS